MELLELHATSIYSSFRIRPRFLAIDHERIVLIAMDKVLIIGHYQDKKSVIILYALSQVLGKIICW